ncbi:unnamed protein product [Ectocarpus sp. 12 AP-2014]
MMTRPLVVRRGARSGRTSTFAPMNVAFAVCKLCPKGSKVGRIKRCGGTSSMSKHINSVHRAEVVTRGTPNNGQTILDSTIETEPHFRRTSLKWMLMAYKPLGATRNPWFRNMIGSVSEVKTATRNQIYEELNSMEAAANQELRKVMADQYFGASTDVWTGTRKNKYISFVVHVYDGRAMRAIDLACAPFREAPHTGTNIAAKLKAILNEKGLDPTKCTGIVTDTHPSEGGGEILTSDMEAFMPAVIPCFCHSLQLAVRRFQGAAKVKGANNADVGAAANPSTPAPTVAAAASTASSAAGVPAQGGGAGAAGAATPSAPTVPDLMTQCNDFFEAYNESQKFAKLLEACADWLPVQSYPLQRCVPASWLDVTMLESLLFNRRAIELAVMKNEAHVPDAAQKLDWGFMEAVLAVLKPFAEATRTMEAEKHPAIGLVLGLVALLRKEIDGLLKHKNGAIRAATRNMSIELGRRYTIDPSAETPGTSGCKKIHYAAAVLDPRAKGMARIPGYVKDYA